MNAKEKLKALITGKISIDELTIKRPVHCQEFEQGIYLNSEVYWEQKRFDSMERAEAYCMEIGIGANKITSDDRNYFVSTGNAFVPKTAERVQPERHYLIWRKGTDCNLYAVDEIPADTASEVFRVYPFI